MKKVLFSRLAITIVLVFIQVLILILGILKLNESFVYFYAFFQVFSIIIVVYIVSRKDNPSFKLAWIILVAFLPLFGGLFYIILGGNKVARHIKKYMDKIDDEYRGSFVQDQKVLEELDNETSTIIAQVNYLYKNYGYPVYKNTTTEYLSPGEDFFEVLIRELKKAKKYIFLEYFIIEEGKMWSSVLDVLKEKVKEGVEVRVIYDDFGCIAKLPNHYEEVLESYNIKVRIFNKVVPIISAVVNNRDHRKIVVIDGHTAFTGGINLADEYINEIEKFGHWKDSAIMLHGEAVWTFTLMFLKMWGESANNINIYKPYIHYEGDFMTDGYVMPYGGNPLTSESIGENVYLNIINKAKKYVYITTPYLIIGNELITSLILAAKSGVDVRIITPHKEDKWYVHIVTRAYYAQLIEAGVKIYEYTPGFIHSKNFVADDKIATVGTINLDYRSLYLHFECGTLLYKTKTIDNIKKDFIATMEKSKFITLEDTKKVKWSNKIIRSIIRVFSPLL